MKIIKIGAMWCPACIVTNKYWKEIKSNFKSINFVDLDIDMDEDEVKKYDVGTILPVVIILDDKEKELKRIIGEKTKEIMNREIGDVVNEN